MTTHLQMTDEEARLRQALDSANAQLRGLQGTLLLQGQLKQARQAHQDGKCIRLPKISAQLFAVPVSEAVPNSSGLPTVTVDSISAACEKPDFDVGMGLHVFELAPGQDPQQPEHYQRKALWASKRMAALMGAPSQEICLEWIHSSVEASIALRNYNNAVLKAYIMGDFTMFMVRTVHYHSDKPADIALMWYLPCIVRHEDNVYKYAFITYSSGQESQLHLYEAVMMDHLGLKFTPVIVSMVELDGTIVHQNAASMAAYGMQGRSCRAEESGTGFNLLHELFAEHPAFKAEMEAVTSANNMFSRHMPIRSQQLRKWLGIDAAREVWHQVQISRTRDAVTMRFLLVVAQMDVTAAVQAANQVARLQAENDDLAWTTAWLEDEKARTDEVNQRLKESLLQALAIRDQSLPGRVKIDSATPADKAVRLLNKVLEGQEVSSQEVMAVRDVILDAGRDLLQPVNFMAQMGAQMGGSLDAEVGQSLIDLLVTQRNIDITAEFHSNHSLGATGMTVSDEEDPTLPPPAFWASQHGVAGEPGNPPVGSKTPDRARTGSATSTEAVCGVRQAAGQRGGCHAAPQVPTPYRPLGHRPSSLTAPPRAAQTELLCSRGSSDGALPKAAPQSTRGITGNGNTRTSHNSMHNAGTTHGLLASDRSISLPAGYSDSSSSLTGTQHLHPVATGRRHRASTEMDAPQAPSSPDTLAMHAAAYGSRGSTPALLGADPQPAGQAPAGLVLRGSVGQPSSDGCRARTEPSRSCNERLIARALALVPHSPPDHLAPLLAAAEGWGWDPWALNEATGGRPLSCLAYYLLHRHNALSSCSIDHARLCRFLVRVEDDYNDANPYHNRIHATDVLQWMHVIMQRGGVFKALQIGDVGKLAVYLSAIVHDLDHRGKTNDFLIKMGDPLALLYNDVSPQENHHVAHFHMLLRQPEYNFLQAAPERVRQNVRKQIIMMVLATDMKQHFLQTSLFKSKLGVTDEAEPSGAASKNSSGHSTPGEPNGVLENGVLPAADSTPPAIVLAAENDDEIKGLILALALKCADLGNLAAPLPVNVMWVTALEEEYFRQGDREQAEGMSVSVLMDRSKAGVSKSQTGFFSVVGLPLFRMFVKAFPEAKPMLDSAQRNFEHWRGVEEEVRRRAAQAAP